MNKIVSFEEKNGAKRYYIEWNTPHRKITVMFSPKGANTTEQELQNLEESEGRG